MTANLKQVVDFHKLFINMNEHFCASAFLLMYETSLMHTNKLIYIFFFVFFFI